MRERVQYLKLGGNPPDPQCDKRGGCDVRSKRETEHKTVPNREDMKKGAVNVLASGKVVSLANAGDCSKIIVSLLF